MVLAILSLVAAALVCVQIGAMARRTAARNAFRPDAGLTSAVDELGAEYEQTMTVFSELYPTLAKGKDFSLSLPRVFVGEKDLEAAQKEVVRIREELAELRIEVLDQFSVPANKLITGMRKKVDKAKDKIADKNEAAVARAERRIRQLLNKMNPARSLYLPFGQSDYRARMEAVTACRGLLGRMYEMTKSESAHALMEACSDALMDIADAYPEPLSDSVLAKLNGQIDDQREKIAELRGEGLQLKGEEIAEELDDYLQAINLGFSTDWKIDQALDSVETAVAENLELAGEAKVRRKEARVTAMQFMACAVVGGLCVAFFLLVVGDFLQAHFDTADHAREATGGALAG
jgi:hypothetical protein